MGNHGGGKGPGDGGQSPTESDGAKDGGSGKHGGGGSSAPTGNPSDGAKPK